jgi:hypothetical protein
MKRLLECASQREVKQVSHEVTREIVQQLHPATIAGKSIADWQRIARSMTADRSDHTDRGVYLIVNRDLTKARLGEGRILTRIRDHIRAFAINESPVLRVLPPRWPMGSPLIELIRETIAEGNKIYYVVLAEGLTKPAALAGQTALFNAFGIRGNGGFFINEQAT